MERWTYKGTERWTDERKQKKRNEEMERWSKGEIK
jgi:hypothetical protein